MFMVYSLASLPFIYVYSFIPMSESVSLIIYIIINILLIFMDMVLGFVVVFLQGQAATNTGGMSSQAVTMTNIRLVLSILFPIVNLKHALFNIHLRSSDTCVSSVNLILGTSYSSTEPWMSVHDPGLGIPFIIFISQMVGWWLILMIIEQSDRICSRRSCCCSDNNPPMVTTEWNDSV
jgi:hypothetical protein